MTGKTYNSKSVEEMTHCQKAKLQVVVCCCFHLRQVFVSVSAVVPKFVQELSCCVV